MSTRNLIDAIASGSALDIESAFEDTMAEKVSVQIEAKRLQIAQTMFTTEEVDLDEEQLNEGDQFAKADHHYNLSNHHDELASSHAYNGDVKKELSHKIKADTHMGKYHDHMSKAQKLPGKRLLGGSSAEHVKWGAAINKSTAKLQAQLNKMNEEMDLDEEQLNELGPETTVSYIHKATKDAHDTVAAANAGGDKAMLQKRLDKRKSGITKAMTKIVRKAKEEQEEQE